MPYDINKTMERAPQAAQMQERGSGSAQMVQQEGKAPIPNRYLPIFCQPKDKWGSAVPVDKLPESYKFGAESNRIVQLEGVLKLKEELTEGNFYDTLRDMVEEGRGNFSQKARKDSEGNWIIGYGFLLHEKGSDSFHKPTKEIFKKVLGVELDDSKLSKEEDAKKYIEDLTISEDKGKEAFNFLADKFLGGLREKVSFFEELPLNTKVALFSLYYHNPVFVGKGLVGCLEGYNQGMKEGNIAKIHESLWAMCEDVLYRSNGYAPYNVTPLQGAESTWMYIQHRRERELAMLVESKFEASVYSGNTLREVLQITKR